MAALRAAASLGLAQWCIGAGAVRNRVWDALHGLGAAHAAPAGSDLDLVYFDATHTGPQHEAALQARLAALQPGLLWEVVNQAGVHHWYGGGVAPLHSLAEGIATWPETATAVGVTLAAGGALRVIAPLGLADLFTLRLRHNPARAPRAVFEQRIATKGWLVRWPRLRVVASTALA
ncbi:MAG: nucleotidyltransferase family protein [Burkholderiales bacterium]|nr:nucleotidyltransferase family protein [Burkholderiales bacterium]